MAIKGRTEIAELGEFRLIERLTKDFAPQVASTVKGVGDDAAVISVGDDKVMVVSTDTMNEGVDFDLTYFPPKHLGYKVVTKGISDVLAMNAVPTQLTIALAVSAKISVEFLDDFYAGVAFACREAEVDLVGGDIGASVTGLSITVTAVGEAKPSEVAYRSGAAEHDLICITGSLGAPYMGLKLLEREKRVLEGVEGMKPQFDGYEYLLERYLKPRARVDIVRSLHELGIVPTSMIDLSDGLASDLLQICKSSACGARIYMERMPIAQQVNRLADEMNFNATIAALNGGDDYELMFTVPLDKREEVLNVGCIDIIGHITKADTGCYLIAPDGSEIRVKAQGFAYDE